MTQGDIHPDTIRKRAEDIEYETSLDTAQAIVLAGKQLDADDSTIANAITRCHKSLDHLLMELRQRGREVDDEIEQLKTEKEYLDGADL